MTCIVISLYMLKYILPNFFLFYQLEPLLAADVLHLSFHLNNMALFYLEKKKEKQGRWAFNFFHKMDPSFHKDDTFQQNMLSVYN